VLTAELTGRNPGISLAEDTDALFVGKTLLHGDVLMWLMKTLLISRCINQRGAGHRDTSDTLHLHFADFDIAQAFFSQSNTLGYNIVILLT
jgi:mannose-6-phosphate isomerase